MKYKCNVCNTVHDINPAKMLGLMAVEDLDKEQRKERMKKALAKRWPKKVDNSVARKRPL